jgi:hypothetical protein
VAKNTVDQEAKADGLALLLTIPVLAVMVYSVYLLYIKFGVSDILNIKRASVAFSGGGLTYVYDLSTGIPPFLTAINKSIDLIMLGEIRSVHGFDILWVFYRPMAILLTVLGTFIAFIMIGTVFSARYTNRLDLDGAGKAQAPLISGIVKLLVAPAYTIAAFFYGSRPQTSGREVVGFIMIIAFSASTYLLWEKDHGKAGGSLADQGFIVKVKDSGKFGSFPSMNEIGSVSEVEERIEHYEILMVTDKREASRRARAQVDQILKSWRFKAVPNPYLEKRDFLLSYYRDGLASVEHKAHSVFNIDLRTGKVSGPRNSVIFHESGTLDGWEAGSYKEMTVGAYTGFEKQVKIKRKSYKECVYRGSFNKIGVKKIAGDLGRITKIIDADNSISGEKKTQLKAKFELYFGERYHVSTTLEQVRFRIKETDEACPPKLDFINKDAMIARL